MRKVLVLALLLAIAVLPLVSGAASNATNSTNATCTGSSCSESTSLSELVQAALTNKQTAIVMLIEFLLGFGLGYTAIKAIKYIIAFIGILLIGSALSVWSFGSGNNQELVRLLGEEFKKLLPIIKSFLTAFSIVVVGPTSIGIIAGILFAVLNK